MDNNFSDKPCLVQTSQGFSLSYKGKLLYSKYSPSKAILQTIQRVQIQEETIIFCYSPVLEYGLNELMEKLPKNCIVIGIELDSQLYSFSLENNNFLKNNKYKNFFYINKNQALDLPQILSKKGKLFNKDYLYKPYNFRRIININISAAVQFYQEEYEKIHNYSTQALMTYWANRVTLVKFGRKYSINLFRNLKNLSLTTPASNFFGKITKAIIVFGAGESVDEGIKFIKNDRDKYFIICVDTSLKSFIDNNICPDLCFLEEAQNIILKSFIGTKNKCHIFAAFTSVNQISQYYQKENISYFASEYIDANFINKLKSQGLLSPVNPPFGSVGLTAFYYASLFRKDYNTPIFFYGLDFSYSTGKTHCKSSLAHYQRLIANNKITSIENFQSAFNQYTYPLKESKRKLWTSPVLKKYADLFINKFSNYQDIDLYKNIYCSTDFGIELAFPHKKPFAKDISDFSIKKILENKNNRISERKIQSYFEEEKSKLLKLKNLLTKKNDLSAQELEAQITELAKDREYLFLHFPDGFEFSYNQSFLNRIRSEIDFFLKIF